MDNHDKNGHESRVILADVFYDFWAHFAMIAMADGIFLLKVLWHYIELSPWE